ncbi:glycosyltransferase [Oceanimonas sp. NS1]|nr:glycosyltransferase [Oceanimonas sp. NS1]
MFVHPTPPGEIGQAYCLPSLKAYSHPPDPLNTPGNFNIKHFKAVWLKPSFAYDRLLRRLGKAHQLYKDIPPSCLLSCLKKRAREQGCSWKKLALQAYESTFTHSTPGINYQYWLKQQQAVILNEQKLLLQQLPHWPRKPVVSVLLPVYNTPPALLAKCINSVKQQLYPNWQLCVADDASANQNTRQALQQLCAGDNRIRLVQRSVNGHISAASNTALALATGDYVALLDHDDLLAPTTLLQVVAAINRQPEALLLYSDEDKINEQENGTIPTLSQAGTRTCCWARTIFLILACINAGECWK